MARQNVRHGQILKRTAVLGTKPERQKSTTAVNSAYQRVFGENPPQMEDAVLECGGADLGVVSGQQTGELAQERSMTMRRIALQAGLALDHKRRWKRALHHATKHHMGELHVGQSLWFLRRGANATKKPTSAFWHPGAVISNTRWPRFGLHTVVP